MTLRSRFLTHCTLCDIDIAHPLTLQSRSFRFLDIIGPMVKRMTITNDAFLEAAQAALSRGKIIIYPTETSYGLGVDATNPKAVERLLTYKGNRLNKALSVAVADEAMARDYIEFNAAVSQLFDSLLPGPVTVISTSLGNVAKKVLSERQTLGVRYSSLPLVSQLVAAFGKPITATSANTSGAKQIYSFEDFERYVPLSRKEMISVFIDAGKLPARPPSTIIDTTLNSSSQLLRQGEVVITEATASTQSKSVEDTIVFGKEFVTKQIDLLSQKPIILALEGELGAGKTHFAKGVAQALSISEVVQSPTYTIMREYPYTLDKVSGTLYHIDTWRLFENEGLDDFKIRELLKPGNLFVIEWQQKIHEWIHSLADDVLVAYVKFDVINEHERTISIQWDRT